MTSFKKVGGNDDLNIMDKIRTDNLVADSITVNKIYIDISDSAEHCFTGICVGMIFIMKEMWNFQEQ